MMNFTKTFGSFRTFGSSAKRFSGAGEHPTGNYFIDHILKDHNNTMYWLLSVDLQLFTLII